MGAFEDLHQHRISGSLAMFDRMIFKGHLTSLYKTGAISALLWAQGYPMKAFSGYAQTVTAKITANAKRLAAEVGRPYLYLENMKTRRPTQSKEDIARAIAQRDGVSEGVVCVLSVVESCKSFRVRGNRETGHIDTIRRERKCVHRYLYLIDPEFGFMHVRLEAWIPYEIQVYVNGREWLARQLDKAGIGYRRYDNALLSIDDLEAASKLCDRFPHRAWPRLLNAFARRMNPVLADIRRAGFGEYYWVLDQAEIATDVMFNTRAVLVRCGPTCSTTPPRTCPPRTCCGSWAASSTPRSPPSPHRDPATARGLAGQAPHGPQLNQGLRQGLCPPRRDRHQQSERVRVLRVFTDERGRRERRWCEMRKGVANLWRYFEVGMGANRRYLDALAAAVPQGEGVRALDALCRSRTKHGPRRRPLQPHRRGRPRPVPSRPRRRARHLRLAQHRHHETSLSASPKGPRRGAPTLRARLSAHRQAPGPWARRQSAQGAPLSPHSLRLPCDDRGHQPPRHPLPAHLPRGRLAPPNAVAGVAQILGRN